MLGRTRSTRRACVVLCIAVVAFAVLLPTLVSDLGSAILVALGLVVPAILVVIVRRAAFRCDEQPASLLSILDARAPPAAA